jgi:organic radical activating enzyme
MMDLKENVYNAKMRRDEPKFKRWRSVGLILTYKCNCACEYCYYACDASKGGLMPVDMAIDTWQAVIRLAGDHARIHLTGGEPFLYWDHMVKILETAQEKTLGPTDMIETNGFWAVTDEIVKERLMRLDRLGMQRLKISCDLYHQQYVDITLVQRLARIAKELLGPERVLVRWQAYLDDPADVSNMSKAQLRQAQIEAAQAFPCRFNGRAACDLADVLSNKTIEEIARFNCTRTFLDAKGVHIDPHGNVFSSTCSGIIVGTVAKQPLDLIWQKFQPKIFPLVSTLTGSGPAGLLQSAQEHGDYIPRPFYASKCHLCSHIRQYFITHDMCSHVVGPSDCYPL